MEHIDLRTVGSRSVAEAEALYKWNHIELTNLLTDNEHAYSYYMVIKPLNGKEDFTFNQLIDKLRDKYKAFRHMIVTQEKAKRIHFNVLIVINDSEFIEKFSERVNWNRYYVSIYRVKAGTEAKLINYVTKDEGDEHYDCKVLTKK